MPEVSSKNRKTYLNPKQQNFVEAYADPNKETCGNAYQSAIKAHYSKSSAKQACVRLVENVGIKAAILQYITKIKQKSIATRVQRQQFWTDTYQDKQSNMGDRLRASELLGKSEADFVEVHQDITDKQRELDEKEALEAKRIANIRLRQV